MRQAVILAGGQATRMRPYTDNRPKAMVEVAGRPIIEHQVRWLSNNGIDEIIVSCGYRAEILESFLGVGSEFGVHIAYAMEDEPLGRGGGLKFASSMLPYKKERWLGLNGDVLADFPLIEMGERHSSIGTVATIALAPYLSTWGIADLEGDLIKGFVEKPRLPYWINAGIYCFEPEIAPMLPAKGDHEDTTFPELAKKGKLGWYGIEGYWRGIDTVKDISEASKELRAT
jgi:NDP-sugar pyrophosphorylase family protein